MHKRKQVTQCLPADEPLLSEFVVFLAKSIKYPSFKTYLAAVRHYHIRHGFTLHMHKMLRLQLVLRGIKRSQGDQIRVRLPIAIHHLKLFQLLLAIPSTTNFDSEMIWAAMTLAFFGFLRLGELTCNSKFNKDIHTYIHTYGEKTYVENYRPIDLSPYSKCPLSMTVGVCMLLSNEMAGI